MHAEFNAKTAATEVIYSAVSGWVGWELKIGDWLPVVRDGKQVGRLGSFQPRDPVDVILRAASLRTVPDLKAERDKLLALLEATRSVQSAATAFSLREQFDLDATWPEKTYQGAEPVDLIHAVGLWKSLRISIHGVIFNAERRLAQIEEELATQGKTTGRPPNRPIYEVAREFAFLYARVTGKVPTYSKDPNGYSGEFSPALSCQALGRDGYGRIIARCFANGKDIGAVLVDAGLAWAFRRYSDDYTAQEAGAKATGIGIWEADNQTPWDYRDDRWDRAAAASPRPGCPIKGNIASDGERIYHTPWSPAYSRTKITDGKGERWFCD